MHKLFYLLDEDLKNETISLYSSRDVSCYASKVLALGDPKFAEFTALKPFTRNSENLLSPICLTKSLLYSLARADKCLAKLPCDNLVKIFLFTSLDDKFKITANLSMVLIY